MILVNLSEVAWSPERRRNASMFLELVRLQRPFTEGIFVSPPRVVARAAGVGERWRALGESLRVAPIEANAWHYAPTFFLPFSGRALIERSTAALFRRVLQRVIRGRPYCLWINCVEPASFALATALAPRAERIVIDLSDDWTAFEDYDPAARARRLDQAIAWSHALIAVNEHVLKKFPHRNARVFTNATDFDNFQRHDRGYVLGTILPKAEGRTIVGFSGGLNIGRVDEPLLDRLTEALPQATFLFVGYSNAPELVARLRARPNVVIHDAVPYNELPNVIRAFDVAIVPHAINEHTRGNDLLKVLDYLASGVPVVSTSCSNVQKYGAALEVATSHDDFIARVAAHLGGKAHDPAPGLAVARAASWGRTVPELARWLEETLR